MERGEADVLHFLFVKNEALIGRGVVRLRDVSSGHRGSRCTTEQRKTQSGRTQPRHGGGLSRAFLPRSLLDPSHGRILSSCERAWRSKFALGERGAQDLPPCQKMKWNLRRRAQAAAHRAPLSETEAPAKTDGRSHARQPARLGTLALDRRPQLKAALRVDSRTRVRPGANRQVRRLLL